MKNLMFVGASASPKRMAAWITVVMGLVCIGPVPGLASESLPISDDQDENLPQKAYFTWVELIQFAASTLCEVVQCAGWAGRAENTSDQAAMVVEAVIDAYRAEGVVAGLTQSEIRRGINAVDYTMYLVDDPASTLDPGLAAEFRGALVELRADLSARLDNSPKP